MDIWDRLGQVDVGNKEIYLNVFSEIVNQIREKNYNFQDGIIEKEFYYIITEENRQNSLFVHIVPKELFGLFKEMQEKAPNQFLGFSVLAGRKDGQDIRVSCFGVPCSLLGKALMK